MDLKDIRDLPREGHGAAGAKKSLMDIRLYLEELPKDMGECSNTGASIVLMGRVALTAWECGARHSLGSHSTAPL